MRAPTRLPDVPLHGAGLSAQSVAQWPHPKGILMSLPAARLLVTEQPCQQRSRLPPPPPRPQLREAALKWRTPAGEGSLWAHCSDGEPPWHAPWSHTHTATCHSHFLPSMWPPPRPSTSSPVGTPAQRTLPALPGPVSKAGSPRLGSPQGGVVPTGRGLSSGLGGGVSSALPLQTGGLGHPARPPR